MELNAAQLLAIEYTIAVAGLYLCYRCFSLKERNMNFFMRFVYILNAFLLINIPIRYIELHLVSWNRTVVFVLYAISVVLMTYTAAYWCLFILRQLNSRIVSTKKRVYVYLTPALLSIILCIINYWTGWLYVIDEQSFYSRGSLFVLQSIISYGYVILVFICGLIHMIKDSDKANAKKCFYATLTSFIGAILQIVFGGSYLLIGVLLTGWMMYLEICLHSQKAYEVSEAVRSMTDELAISNNAIAQNMKTILALSDIYYVLVEADLVNDTLNVIKAPDYVADFCNQFKSAKACLEAVPEGLYDSAYWGVMSIFYDVEMINECLANKNTYFVDTKGTYVKDWIRSTMIAAERDDDGNVTRVIFSIEEIGDIIEQQQKIEEAKVYEMHAHEMEELFIQTADALASAIDAKDAYTHGHSRRVAEYARQIAKETGRSEEICENVYIAGLLHDVGKIGIQDTILTKAGKLTDEEFATIKQHSNLGYNILSGITSVPYLAVSAHYHHERYDGKGYPEGLKGEEIPELARIITVADSYDAMTSSRSYRTPLAQQKVREELVKGIGTQFDPEFAKAMVHLLDKDTEYELKDDETRFDNILEQYTFEEYKEHGTEGIQISEAITTITFTYQPTKQEADAFPAIVVFDSLDARIYIDEANQNKMDYTGFCDILFNGDVIADQIRDYQVKESELNAKDVVAGNEIKIEAVRQRDHILIKVFTQNVIREYTLALHDRSQYAFVAITGKNCEVTNFKVRKSINPVEEGYISRIAEEISYIRGCIKGDLANLEIAGWRENHSEGILVENAMDISFHTMSLPAARRLWHCPILVFFTSTDGKIYGPGYREFALVRFDGESWEEDKVASNQLDVSFGEGFESWDAWKKANKEGVDCTVHIEKRKNNILLQANEDGVLIQNITTISEDIPNLYCAITGDQVAITSIYVNR